MDPVVEIFSNISNTTNLTHAESLSNGSSCDVECMKAYAYRVVAPLVIGIGILGNILNLVVLTRPNLKGVTYVYLQWLAISDLFALVFAIPLIARITDVHLKTYTFAIYHAYFELTLLNLFLTTSVFIVICVTIDRFFSVCLPTKYKDIHTLKRARVAVTLSFVSAIVFYTPMAFRKKIVPLNSTIPQLYAVKDKSYIVTNKAYKLYKILRECICRFLPIVALAILNVSIVVCFRRIVRRRERMLSGSGVNSRTTKKENKRFQEEKRLVILLIGIVFLFLCCITPSAVNMLFIRDDLEKNFGYQVFRAAANILEFVNSSLNFFVYCLCSSEIRGTLFNLFGIKAKRYMNHPSQSRMSEDVQNAQQTATRSTRF